MDYTTVTVVSVTDVGGDAVAVELATPVGFGGRPGQFVSLRLDADTPARFYTLSSADSVDSFEVTVGVDAEGDVSPRIAALDPGDELDVSAPLGDTFYDGESSVLVVAGGPGIGAAVAIAERAIRDGGDAVVVYRDDAPSHEPRLAALSRAGAIVVVLRPDGDLDTAIGSVVARGVDTAFVFGFNDFVTAAADALDAAGVPDTNVEKEGFGPAPGN